MPRSRCRSVRTRHDASVRAVVLSWPVINPLSRYRHAKRALASGGDWAKSMIPRHDSYWRSEAAMAEGNPLLALERGEKVLTPPAIWFQGRGDIVHDYKDAEVGFPRQRAAALCRRLPQGGRRHRARIHRHGPPCRSRAGSVENRRHVRAHGGIRRPAYQSRLAHDPESLPSDLIRGWIPVSRLREARFHLRAPRFGELKPSVAREASVGVGGRRKVRKIMRKQNMRSSCPAGGKSP